MCAENLFILTGSPGTGKTAILAELASGFRCVAEPAREILAEQRSTGGAGTPDRDPSLFMDLLLRRSIDKYEAARRLGEPAVFDRGIPDCIAYAARLGLDPMPSIVASKRYRYNAEVLVLEPWEDIYSIDEERTMSFKDTVEFHAAIKDAFELAGYALVEVPRDSVENRAGFVRHFITQRGYR
jgi:predicted ATPase